MLLSEDHMSSYPAAPAWSRSQQCWWIVAHVLAGLVGVTILRLALGVSDWVVFGPVFGGVQWLLLRHYLRGGGWWLLVSTLGGLSGVLLNQALSISGLFQNSFIAYPISGLTYGAALGGAQWLVLRRWTGRATRWVLINAGAGGAGVALAVVVNRVWVSLLGERGDGVAAWAVFGLVYGLFLNRTLAHLFHQMQSSRS
jgi:hypothetical protein